MASGRGQERQVDEAQASSRVTRLLGMTAACMVNYTCETHARRMDEGFCEQTTSRICHNSHDFPAQE